MDLNQLFQVALGVNQPWFIDSVYLDELKNSVEIKIDFTVGSTFKCPNCANECTAYDSKEKALSEFCRNANLGRYRL